MLLGYIWTVFFTIPFLLGITCTFIIPNSNILQHANAIPERVIALFGFLKGPFERTLVPAGLVIFLLYLLKMTERSGLIEKRFCFIGPFLFKLFPAMGCILINVFISF